MIMIIVVEEEAHCFVVLCRCLRTLNNVAMSLFFYIIDRWEQAKPRTDYKLRKYRERLANLLD